MVANVSTPVVLTLNDFGDYSDIDGPSTLAAVEITALPSAGSLQQYDTGSGMWAPVELNDPISAADIAAGHLQFVPDAGEFGVATIGFKVGDGHDFSADSYTLAVNVTFELSSLNGSNGFPISGVAGQSGWSVASAGDINGDGFDAAALISLHSMRSTGRTARSVWRSSTELTASRSAAQRPMIRVASPSPPRVTSMATALMI